MAHLSRKISRAKESLPKNKPALKERFRALLSATANGLHIAEIMAICIFGVITLIAAVFGYVPLVISAVLAGACVAYVCGRAVHEEPISAMPKLLTAALYSLLVGVFFFISALIRGAGSIGIAASSAAAFAVLYVTVLLECVLCKHIGKKRFSAAISFTGYYMIGVPLTLVFVLIASRVPMGESSDGSIIITASAAAVFAALYALLTVLRLWYLYFILRRRLREYMNK